MKSGSASPDLGSLRAICVYCGSNPGSSPAFTEAARKFGGELARRGITLVYGGGKTGMMGAVAEGALSEGGKVIGVIPVALVERELAHHGVTELRIVSSMHERKVMMADLSDAFVAMPGGIGTLEEIFEVFTWTQLGIHAKPCGFLDVEDYYQPLIAFLENVVASEFLHAEHLGALIVDTDQERLLERLASYEHAEINKWIASAAPATPPGT